MEGRRGSGHGCGSEATTAAHRGNARGGVGRDLARALEFGQISLRLLFRITHDQQGGFGGTVDSLDQGAMGLKISRVRFKDNSVRLRLDRPLASFEGTISADGSEIVGHWRQSGRSTPLTIKRQKNAPDRARPQNLK